MAIRASAERPGAFLPRPSEALRITGEGGFGLLVLRVFLGFIFPTPCSWIRGRNRRNSETCAWRTCRGERLKRSAISTQRTHWGCLSVRQEQSYGRPAPAKRRI